MNHLEALFAIQVLKFELTARKSYPDVIRKLSPIADGS